MRSSDMIAYLLSPIESRFHTVSLLVKEDVLFELYNPSRVCSQRSLAMGMSYSIEFGFFLTYLLRLL